MLKLSCTCDAGDLDILEDKKAHEGPATLCCGPENSPSAADPADAVLEGAVNGRPGR